MGIEIIHGDCVDIMKTIDWSCVGMVIADPPYGDTSLEWDKFCCKWMEQIRLEPWASMWMFGSLKSLLKTDLTSWSIAQDLIWEKHNGSGFANDRFKRVHEHIVHLYRGRWEDVYKCPQFSLDATKRTVRRKKRPPHTGGIAESQYESEDGGPRLLRSIQKIRSCHGYAIHPTEKPVDLLRILIRYSCPQNKTVLSPFGGSGSDAEAAEIEGRNSIVIEKDHYYIEKIRERLSQGRLFSLVPRLT